MGNVNHLARAKKLDKRVYSNRTVLALSVFNLGVNRLPNQMEQELTAVGSRVVQTDLSGNLQLAL